MNLKRNIYDHLAKWIGEVQLQSPLAKEEIDENIEPSKDIRERIINDIKYLDKKIDYNANEWKAWDLLNIIDSCSSDSEIDNKIANLAPNTGLVINGTLSRYNRGDIIFKKGDGSIILVPSESQGLYFPTSIKKIVGSETYSITFAYAEETTEEAITVAVDIVNKDQLLINLKNLLEKDEEGEEKETDFNNGVNAAIEEVPEEFVYVNYYDMLATFSDLLEKDEGGKEIATDFNKGVNAAINTLNKMTIATSAGSSITFEGFNAASAGQAISYEHVFSPTDAEQPFLFPIKKYGTNIIWPVIRCYDVNGEIVECEFTLKEVGNNFSISDIPNIVFKVVVR